MADKKALEKSKNQEAAAGAANGWKFPKEYVLLFLGAIISIATTLIINSVNNKHDEKKQTRTERIQFADSLMRGLAKRFSYTSEYYNAKTDGKTAAEERWTILNEDLEVYLASNVYYNYSRLRNLFSDSLAEAFKKSVDDPFDIYKNYIENTPGAQLKLDYDSVVKKQAALDTATHNFALVLYRKAFVHD